MILTLLIAVAGAGLLALAYASLVERNWFALRRHRVPCLPEGSAPMTLLHFSDLHLLRRQRRKRRFIESCAALEPDLAVGTGDFIGEPGAWADAADAIMATKPRLAGLFVLGSNDYYGPKPKNPFAYFKHRDPTQYRHGPPNETWPDMVRRLEEGGWRLVNNVACTVDGIDVAGLDDPHIARHDLSIATPRSAPGFRLGIVHSPDAAPALAQLGYDLILCGHTHGGQLRLPGFGALVTNSTLPRRYARGLHRFQGAWLHVSAGMGTSKYAPIRFFCRPEICLLELVPRAAGHAADAAGQRSASTRS